MKRSSRYAVAVAGATMLVGAVLTAALPQDRSQWAVAPTPVAPTEHARTIEAMRPHTNDRPVVAIIGHNDGTETTDYLVPYAVLTEADVADVEALSLHAGPMKLTPALTIQAQSTFAEFDARHRDGADYVVVAAMHPRNDPAVLAWLQAQAEKGAIIVGVCSGVRTLSAAGLLANRRAARYWYDAEDLAEASPTTQWVADRRYVVDRPIVTTTGISASMPISLALVEAIGGAERAQAMADYFGVASWDARHHTGRFGFDRRMLVAALGNKLAPWSHERVGIPVSAGVDEVSLAFVADAWSRTFRSDVVAMASQDGAVQTRRGLTLLPDAVANPSAADFVLSQPMDDRAGRALDGNLADIADRYGADTAAFVTVQLEHPHLPSPSIRSKPSRVADGAMN